MSPVPSVVTPLTLSPSIAQAIAKVQLNDDDLEEVPGFPEEMVLHRLKKGMRQFDIIFQQAISEIEPLIRQRQDGDLNASVEPIPRVLDFQKGALTASSWAFAIPLPRKRNLSAGAASPAPQEPLPADTATRPQVTFWDDKNRKVSTVWKPFSADQCEGYLLESGVTMGITGEGISVILIQWRGDSDGVGREK
ncbi:hypothetical protein B0T14DRAFT_562932 [Immersiella caudata]|uniref:Uncharacterized protein n=1 Tax=Immersiella caudata TaxID=314043 RepID=A0AA39X4F8_9PEZI|nr:hypothetical protein B0T14DRAFT_562932 [Immersiella caudata]